LDLFYFIF